MNFAQRFVHRKLGEQLERDRRVRAIILKARQEGISTLVAGRNFRRMHLDLHKRAAVIADKKERASDLFSIYARFDENLPPHMRPKRRSRARGRQLEYEHDCLLKVETA